ncbi:MAG TPA: preprotein translocase subunit YajC [Bacillota bacterium]|nr:preprotein translocase subunit YajC [Bacillota bacterium]
MDLLVTFAPLIILVIVFYFFLIRPQQKRQKEVREMQGALQKGDKIVTIGGLHGEIHAVDEDQVVLKVGNTNLTYDRAAIRDVTNK